METDKKKAIEAAQILQSEVFSDAVSNIQSRAFEQWQNSKTQQEREEAWYLQRAIAILHREIFNVLQCAAVRAGGKDEQLNREVARTKEKVNGRKRK